MCRPGRNKNTNTFKHWERDIYFNNSGTTKEKMDN